MEPQRLLTDAPGPSSGAYNKTEKRGTSLCRWMLCILFVISASLLYIFDIAEEMRYRIVLPRSVIPSE